MFLISILSDLGSEGNLWGVLFWGWFGQLVQFLLKFVEAGFAGFWVLPDIGNPYSLLGELWACWMADKCFFVQEEFISGHMAEKFGPASRGAAAGFGKEGMAVLNIKPLTFELPAPHSPLDVEDGSQACRIARKKKRDYLAYQRQQMDKFSHCIFAPRESHVENQNQGAHSQSCRPNQANNRPGAIGHQSRNRGEEGIAHDEGVGSGEAEKTKWILSKYRGLVQRMIQEQEAVEPQDASNKLTLHSKAASKLRPLWQNCAKRRIGPVPGVEVGDRFQHRMEMHIIGLHRPLVSGIDYLRSEGSNYGVPLGTSVVVAGGYEDNIDNGDVVIYTGQGGNDFNGNRKQIGDQMLNLENAALRNSCRFKKPVRVIRGFKLPSAKKNLPYGRFRYDGLYDVERWWQEEGRSGFMVYKFKLKRQQGQPPLAFHAVRFIGKSGSQKARRENVIMEDVGEGLDKAHISVVNAVDGECSLDGFTYRVAVKYPDWLGKLGLPEGCQCVGECNDVKNCLCARRNGGEFPYTRKGTLVRAKPLVHECGPSCRCPPTCANRVAQHGLKHKLEIFRTPSKNWGVRSLDFIEAGRFIIEYTGDLVADPASNDPHNKFVFPISAIAMEGSWGDLRGVVDDKVISAHPCQLVEDVGFKVDASSSGNASRFISRSCRPNIFAQYVLYDHDDIRIPHVMLFALENIPPHIEFKLSSSPQQSISDQSNRKTGYGRVTRI